MTKEETKHASGQTRKFSHNRRFFVPVLVLFVFFVLVIIVVGVSRRHCVAHDGDQAAVD
jgi:hypothetical protein